MELKRYTLLLAVVWTVAVGVSLAWNYRDEQDAASQAATVAAREQFAKDDGKGVPQVPRRSGLQGGRRARWDQRVDADGPVRGNLAETNERHWRRPRRIVAAGPRSAGLRHSPRPTACA